MTVARVYIGFDAKDAEAYAVAEYTLRKHASIPVVVTPLHLAKLRAAQLIWRRMEMREGRLWDLLSKAYASTEFAISRFLVPLLTQTGWSLFVDPDVVFEADVAELFALADDRYAAMCVHHPDLPTEGAKMDGQVQQAYPRKNWSSVVLWHADHPANERLTLGTMNNYPGRDLHRFGWLNDAELGALPPEWNWLVGLQKRPERVCVAHLTTGGPWLPDWTGGEYDDAWRAARAEIG